MKDIVVLEKKVGPFPPQSRTGQIAIKSWPQLGQNQKLSESPQLPQNKALR